MREKEVTMPGMLFWSAKCPECQHIHTPKRPFKGGAAFTCKGCGLLLIRPKNPTEPVMSFHAYINSRNPDYPADGGASEPEDDTPAREPAPKRIPRRAKYGAHVYDVLHYAGDNHFVLLDGNARLTVARSKLIFIKEA